MGHIHPWGLAKFHSGGLSSLGSPELQAVGWLGHPRARDKEMCEEGGNSGSTWWFFCLFVSGEESEQILLDCCCRATFQRLSRQIWTGSQNLPL